MEKTLNFKAAVAAAALVVLMMVPQGVRGQVDENLYKDIVESGYIHKPLKLHPEKSVEAFCAQKTVLESELLSGVETLDGWTHDGHGTMSLGDKAVEGSHSLKLESPAHPEQMLGRGLGRGFCEAVLNVGGADWRGYNRISFSIYPDCPGARTVYLALTVQNDGEIKTPDKYDREGEHEINLKNQQWNECSLEMPILPRDKVAGLRFAIDLFGQELSMPDTVVYYVDNIRLEKIEDPEPVLGWKPADGRIIFSTTGYTTKAEKTALSTVEGASKFFVRDYRTGRKVFRGKIRQDSTRLGLFNVMDFSRLRRPGRYYLEAGGVKTEPFYIDDDVWEDSAWRVLNFLFCERCGYPVPGHHGMCHNDLHFEYDGGIYPIHGGWHDAGDMSQQFIQSAEIAFSLLQMAQTAKEKGNIDLYNRMMEEGLWGIDLVLRTRLGDGVRAISWGTNLWTDGKIGTDDDSGRREVRVDNRAYENYLYSGIEAYAAMVCTDDPGLCEKLRTAAQEDFEFAQKRFAELGFEELRIASPRGHISMTSYSQYSAGISWAASQLYELTGEEQYAVIAADAIKYTLDCQQIEPIGGLSGFFYRNDKRNSTVHYNHQSRDYAYMQALQALLKTQPENPEAPRWKASVKLYGDYMKAMMSYVAPYGMIPSGVYNINEAKADSVEFYIWQVGVKADGEKDYEDMLRNGVQLDDEHYLRVFPVWYSFKGNTAVNLAAGKSAAICADILDDQELRDIAERQLSWVTGFNPFGQSLIYGEGSYYCQLYNALPGEMVGEIPVGMQALFNGDEPYWPQFNTATYREVWGGTAVRWLLLASEF